MKHARLTTAAGQACLMEFDRTNDEAVEWARTRAAGLVVEVNRETRKAIRAIIAQAFEDGLPPRVAARLIRDVVGLRSDQVLAVASLRRRIKLAESQAKRTGKSVSVPFGNKSVTVPKSGLPTSRLNSTLRSYAETLRRQRALLIARTETINASNQGQIELWRQAKENGLLRGNEKKRWTTTPDDRACPSCIELDGETIEMNEMFTSTYYGSVSGPTLHPNCRCALVLEVPRQRRR